MLRRVEGRVSTVDTVLLAVGAGALLAGVLGDGLITIVLYGCGLIGLARATSPRFAIPLVLTLLCAGFLVNVWDLVPAALSPDREFRDESRAIYLTPMRLGSLLFDLLMAGSALLAARRVGGGLAGITAAFALVAAIALVGQTVVENSMHESDLAEQTRNGHAGLLFVLRSTSQGTWTVARALTAGIWVALPFVHSLPTARAPRRALALLGAAAAALVAATLTSPPVDLGNDMEWGEPLYFLTAVIAWALTAAGMLGLRQELGSLATVGMALVLSQLLCCPLAFWLFRTISEDNFFVLVYTPATLALGGIALAVLPTKETSMRPLRFVIVGLALIAIFGVLLSVFAYLLATSEAVELRIDDPFEPMKRYTATAGAHALVAWSLFVALLARRDVRAQTLA